MVRPEYSAEIRKRIMSGEKGAVYVTADFSDIAVAPTVKVGLARLENEGILRRILRGVYEYPEYSDFLQEHIAPDPDKVARAVARNFGWTIVPCGNTALNMLGLSTQVPAVWSYVSDGPYKTYEYGTIILEFKHTTNKEITGISPKSALVIQALKSLGKENLTEAIGKLTRTLTAEEKESLLSETQYATSWVYEAVKIICKGNYNNA